MRVKLSILAFALAFASAAEAGELVLARKGVPPLAQAVRLPDSPTESQRFAAQELRNYAKRIAGAKLSARVVFENPDASLGEEGFRLFVSGGELHIVGGKRGALYGVYEILERFGGCGWFSHTTEVVPETGRLAVPDDLDVTERPAFALRSTSWGVVARHPVHASHLRINASVTPPIPEARGGLGYRFAKGAGICHTFNGQLPSEVWFKDHPEFFSERDGKRRGGRESQPCLSNPAVLAIVTSNVLACLEKDPGANMVGVSQNDNQLYCQCAACRAIDEEEGSHCGTLLRFVNAVAAEVEKVRPDVLVQTLVYQYSRPLPKLVRPRHNVTPCLCSIECRRHVALDDPSDAPNAKFMKDLADWGRVSDKLYIWDYTTNYRNFLYPMTIEGILGPNLRTLRANNARLMFPEGGGYGASAEFAQLKTYLLAKLMWNPDLDVKVLTDRFFAGYYGAAAPHVREYYERTRAEAAKAKKPFGIFNAAPPAWYGPEFSAWSREKFRLAVAAVADDPVRLRNVREAELTPIVIELDRFAERAKTFFVSRRPETFPTCDALCGDYGHVLAFMEAARKRHEPVKLAAGLCWEPCKLADWKRAFGGTIDRTPRDELTLGSDALFIVSGRHAKATADKTACGGSALRLLPTSSGMMAKLFFRNVAFDAEADYEVSFRCKVEKDAADGEALQAALGPEGAQRIANLGEAEATGKTAELMTRRASEVSEDWQWHSFRPRKLRENFSLSIGSGAWTRGGGNGVTRGVLVDAVRIRRR